MASFIPTTPITSAELNVEDDGGRGSTTSSCITSTAGIPALPMNAMSSSFCYENSGSSGCSSLSNSPTSSSASVSASTSTPMNSENCVSPITANRNLGESFEISSKNYSTSILRHQVSNNTNDFNVGKIIGTKSKTDNNKSGISNIIMRSPHVTPLILETSKQPTTAGLEVPIQDIQFESLRDNLALDYSFQEQQQQHVHSSQQNQLMLPQQNYMHQSLTTLNNDDARTLQLAVELSSMMSLNQHLLNENKQQLQSHMRFEDTNTKYYSYASYEMNSSTSNKSLLQPLSYNTSLTNQSIQNNTLNEASAIVPLGTLSEERSKKSQNMTECVPVPSSEHVAEIVGRQGCKIKALRAKTNTYIKTPVRNEEPVFVVTGRKEDVNKAKCEILSAAEHFTLIRATRRGEVAGPIVGSGGSAINCGYLTNNDLFDNSNSSLTTRNSLGSTGITHGQVTIQVRVPYRVVGLVVGPKGNTIKHIQHETQTYIVTPSRDKEPIFEVTGFLYNVQAARKHIEAHIAMRTGSTGTNLISTNTNDKNTEASSPTNTNSLGANLPVPSKLSNESFIMNRLTNHYNSQEPLNTQVTEQHIGAAVHSEAKSNAVNILTGAAESVIQYCATTKDDRAPLLPDAKLESISPYKKKLSINAPCSSSSSPPTVEVNLMSTNRVEPCLSTLNNHLNHIVKDKTICQMDMLPSMYEKGISNLPYEYQQQPNVQQQAAINTKLIDPTVTIGNILKLGLSASSDTCGGGNSILSRSGNGEIDPFYNQGIDGNKEQKQLAQEFQVIPINGSASFSLPLSDVYDNLSDQKVNSINRNKPSSSINNQALAPAGLKMVKSSNKAINAVNATEMIGCALTRCCSSASSNASSSSKSISQYNNCNGVGNGNGISTNSTTLKKKSYYQDTLDVDEGIGESPNIWKLPKKLGVITSSYCPNTIHADSGDAIAYSNYNEIRNKPIIIHGPMEHNGKTRIKRDCCICHEKEMVAALIPCGHKMFCVNCANSICTSKEPVCPFCCMRVYQAVKILN